MSDSSIGIGNLQIKTHDNGDGTQSGTMAIVSSIPISIDQTTDETTNRVVAKISQTSGENIIQKFGRQQLILTTSPLLVNGTYTSQTFDTLAMPQINYVNSHCYADQSGTLSMLISMDGTNWNLSQLVEPISTNTATVIGWQQPYDRYFRIVFQNGSTAQSTFRLSCTMHD